MRGATWTTYLMFLVSYFSGRDVVSRDPYPKSHIEIQGHNDNSCDPTKKTCQNVSEISEDYDGHIKKSTIRVRTAEKESPHWKSSQSRHKRQTPIVGSQCQENIDCFTTDGGAYCNTTKRCDCLSTYININDYCWAKRNPGDSCQYTEQCTAVSSNTYCDTDGICKCSNNQQPYRTVDDDGPFCLLPRECPTNGEHAKLRDPDTGVDMKCGGSGDFDCSDPGKKPGPQDMYTCICNKSDVVPFKPCAKDESGFCCPSRASACIQSRDEGTVSRGGVGVQQRWWYNTITRTCETFTYRGSGGNVCIRGPRHPFTPRCTAGGGCGNEPDYTCRVEGRSTVGGYCCPTADFICGSNGGIRQPVPPEITFSMPDSGDRSFNVKPVQRWSYESSNRQCKIFTYNGYGGTFNNFQTEAECLSYCLSTACPSGGEPLRDSGGLVMKCGGGGQSCPMKYECTASGFCCPSINFLCSRPLAIGGCSHFAERWWFNPRTRNCESFFYSGCQGNDNNFDLYETCMERCTPSAAKPICPHGEAAMDSGGAEYIVCSGLGTTVTSCPPDYYCHYDGERYGCCPTRTKTCTMDPQDPGTPCVTPVTRWYYNPDTRLCDTFTYNGCDGNSNNFATKIDCQDYCGVGGCPEGGEPFRDFANGVYRVCGLDGAECPSGHRCTILTLGTGTRYNYCCPTREAVCASNQDVGQLCGTSTLTRYHFNIATRTCDPFVYNGCGGNRNNFASVDECWTYCSSAGCPPGEVAMQDPITHKVSPCDPASAMSCSTNHKCVFSTTLQQGVCCGGTAPPGACPSGQIAYMDSFTNAPLQCQPNVVDSCPNGIFCQYSFVLLNSFCCGPLIPPCSGGGDPYHDTNDQPRQCTPGVADVCPPSYTCQATTVLIGDVASATGYCCGHPNVCGTGYFPYLSNNRPIPCVLDQQQLSCPAPFRCRQNVNTQLSYCCAPSAAVTSVCGVGKQPYLIEGMPTLCTQSIPNGACPAGYSCDLHSSSGSYYCCRITAIISATRCPPPTVSLQPMRPCSPAVIGSCPAGYFCTWDQMDSRYICCGRPGIPANVVVAPITSRYCPANSQVHRNPVTGQPHACILGSLTTGCPIGFGCSYSNVHRNYYCCARRAASGAGDFGCPNGAAFLYPGTRAPLVCSKSTQCPRGYSCQKSTRSSAYQCCMDSKKQMGDKP